MRLTNVLLKWHPEFRGYIPKYPGNVLIGKHRFVPPITRMAKYFMLRQILNEENSIKLLENPYISEKQEQAYLQSVGRTHPAYYDEFMHKKVVKPDQQVYSAEFLTRLDKTRCHEYLE